VLGWEKSRWEIISPCNIVTIRQPLCSSTRHASSGWGSRWYYVEAHGKW
jgi:hypothetical protein